MKNHQGEPEQCRTDGSGWGIPEEGKDSSLQLPKVKPPRLWNSGTMRIQGILKESSERKRESNKREKST